MDDFYRKQFFHRPPPVRRPHPHGLLDARTNQLIGHPSHTFGPKHHRPQPGPRFQPHGVYPPRPRFSQPQHARGRPEEFEPVRRNLKITTRPERVEKRPSDVFRRLGKPVRQNVADHSIHEELAYKQHMDKLKAIQDSKKPMVKEVSEENVVTPSDAHNGKMNDPGNFEQDPQSGKEEIADLSLLAQYLLHKRTLKLAQGKERDSKNKDSTAKDMDISEVPPSSGADNVSQTNEREDANTNVNDMEISVDPSPSVESIVKNAEKLPSLEICAETVLSNGGSNEKPTENVNNVVNDVSTVEVKPDNISKKECDKTPTSLRQVTKDVSEDSRHLLITTHFENSSKGSPSDNSKKEIPPENRSKKQDNNWFCGVCNLNISEEKIEHLRSESHKANKKWFRPRCTDCDLWFNRPRQLINHVKSAEHKERAKKGRQDKNSCPSVEEKNELVLSTENIKEESQNVELEPLTCAIAEVEDKTTEIKQEDDSPNIHKFSPEDSNKDMVIKDEPSEELLATKKPVIDTYVSEVENFLSLSPQKKVLKTPEKPVIDTKVSETENFPSPSLQPQKRAKDLPHIIPVAGFYCEVCCDFFFDEPSTLSHCNTADHLDKVVNNSEEPPQTSDVPTSSSTSSTNSRTPKTRRGKRPSTSDTCQLENPRSEKKPPSEALKSPSRKAPPSSPGVAGKPNLRKGTKKTRGSSSSDNDNGKMWSYIIPKKSKIS